jgi:hypothetical protein
MRQQYNDGVSHNDGEKVPRTINEVMCEKKFIWKGESKTPPEDLHRAMLIGGWEACLTKILSMQNAGQHNRARFCPRLARASAPQTWTVDSLKTPLRAIPAKKTGRCSSRTQPSA